MSKDYMALIVDCTLDYKLLYNVTFAVYIKLPKIIIGGLYIIEFHSRREFRLIDGKGKNEGKTSWCYCLTFLYRPSM